MEFEYGNHLIINNDGAWIVRLKLKSGDLDISTTNLNSGKKYITRYNASILSDEEFIKQQEIKGHKVIS